MKTINHSTHFKIILILKTGYGLIIMKAELQFLKSFNMEFDSNFCLKNNCNNPAYLFQKEKTTKNQTLTKRDKKGGRTVKRLDTKIKKRENEIEVDF